MVLTPECPRQFFLLQSIRGNLFHEKWRRIALFRINPLPRENYLFILAATGICLCPDMVRGCVCEVEWTQIIYYWPFQGPAGLVLDNTVYYSQYRRLLWQSADPSKSIHCMSSLDCVTHYIVAYLPVLRICSRRSDEWKIL
jgi:hypothetical protein